MLDVDHNSPPLRRRKRKSKCDSTPPSLSRATSRAVRERKEDYQPSSDPVPETPTGNEDYSSSPSSPDISYTIHPDPPLPTVNIVKNKGNLSLIKCYFDSPKAPGELDDSGFHVSTILII